MRRATTATLLTGISLLIMMCSENESLNDLNGIMEITCAPDTNQYIVYADSLLVNIMTVRRDSIRWVYEVPSGGTSSVSVVISGQIEGTCSVGTLDSVVNSTIVENSRLEVAAYSSSGDVASIVPLAHDSFGRFSDTVLIASSDLPESILTQGGGFIVKYGEMVDTIRLSNPW